MNYSEKIAASSFVDVPDARRLELLNSQLRYAAERSRFYRERLGSPAPLKALGELESLPFTTVDDIRGEGRALLCVPAGEVWRIVSLFSSGSTGEPKRICFTRGDLQRTIDFFSEGMGWLCAPGDRVGILLPCTAPDGVGDLLARGIEKLGALPLRLGTVSRAGDLLPALRRERPEVYVGMPWQLRLLALACPELRPKTVLLSADYVPETIYPFLREMWGCEVVSHFGMTETCFGCAVESLEHDGLYLRRDEFVAEVVDPGGRPLPPGETGELVLTTLRREAMPLIRYRTGDRARFVRGDPCRIERVAGRIASSAAPYLLQERLCALPWLCDYRTEDGVLRALVTRGAPADCEAVLSAMAKEALARPLRVTAERTDAENAASMFGGKRVT